MPDVWAPASWDDYLARFTNPNVNPYENDPEPAAYGGTDAGPTYSPPIPATPEDVDSLSQKRLDDALAKGTGPYPEGARTDEARIAQSTGPTGTINQIGHDSLGQQQEAPLGWEGLSPAEESQIEIDGLQTPPMLGQVDAVSSPAPSTVAQAADVTGVDRSQQAPTTDQLLTPSDAALPSAREREDQQSGEQLGADMAGKSPQEQALFLEKIRLAHDNFAASRALEESNKAVENAHEFARIRDEAIKKSQARRVDLEAQAKRIADTDPATTIPGYKKLFGIIAAFVGGFAANKTGRNVGLEIVDSIANEAAQQQQQKLGLIKNQIAGTGDDIATAESDYHNGYAALIATYDVTEKALKSEVQLYDKKGTAAANIMQTLGEIQARRAAAVEKYQQQDFENQMKAGALAIQSRQQGLAETKFLTDEQRKAAAAMLGSGVKQSPEFWEAYSTRPGVPGERPPMAMTEKEYNTWLATAGKVKALNKGPGGDKSEAQIRKEEADATKAEAEADAAKHGFEIANPETKQVLTKQDGTPFVIADADARKEVRNQFAAAVNIRRLADAMARAQKTLGGGNKLLGTKDAQEILSLTKQLDFETYKAFGLGAPSAGDQSMAEDVRGGVDPTSFVKNATAGWQAYADGVEKKINTYLGAHGYDGKFVKFHRESDLKKAEPTVVDEIGGRLTSSLLKLPGKADPNDPLAQGVDKFNQAIVGNQNKSTEEDLQKLAAYAEQTNDTGDLARKYLQDLATKAVYPDVKAKAKAILDGLPGSHVRTDEAR